MRAEWKYLRYVVLHKLYVLRAGLAIAKHFARPQNRVAWLWRLLVHDLSKFGRAEWPAYAVQFYGDSIEIECPKCKQEPTGWKCSNPPICLDCGHHMTFDELRADEKRIAIEKRERKLAFQRAWLHHIHCNPHHWQHHVLLEDSGKTIVLIPPAVLTYEMVADWLAAGPKALRAHSMHEAVAETIVWYAANHKQMQMREIVRTTAESILATLAEVYGVKAAAEQIASAQRTRASITIPGR